MASIRWFRCTDVHCDCRTTAPAAMWSVVPGLDELAMTALVSAVYRALGPAPGLTTTEERALIDGVAARLRADHDGDLIRACPWRTAREVLAARSPREVPAPVTLASRRIEARAA